MRLRSIAIELGLEGLLSPEVLGAEWEHSLHELSPQVKKCVGAEAVTACLEEMGIPQVKLLLKARNNDLGTPCHLLWNYVICCAIYDLIS